MTIQGPAKFNDEQFELLAIPNYVRLNRGGRTIVWISNIKIVIPEPGTGLIWSGGPYTLDGIDDYISLPVDILTNCSDFTIATWVKLDTRRQWARIFDVGTDTTTNMFLTEEASTGNIRFAVTIGGSGAEEQINGSSPVATGSWQHVAVTLSQTEGKLYVNGSLMGSNTIHISPYLLGHTNHNYIGKSQYNDPYLDGQIDDFRIYNYALSSDDIKALAELRSYAE
ncbi:MAG: LamG domain-containing protein [Sedimentisphaerales bacterium]